MPNDLEKKEALLKLIRDAEAIDAQLREQFQIGEKFRFIRDRIRALSARVEDSVQNIKAPEDKADQALGEDETLVYIYIFNAQGLNLQSWIKMLSPSVYYEYSVNRPLYLNKKDVDAIIRTKANKVQQGYIAVRVKKADIIDEGLKDALGSPLVKVKEGTLRAEAFVSFTHNFIEYKLSPENTLVRK